jgi:hypothetical protein
VLKGSSNPNRNLILGTPRGHNFFEPENVMAVSATNAKKKKFVVSSLLHQNKLDFEEIAMATPTHHKIKKPGFLVPDIS